MKLSNFILCASFVVPLNQPENWESLTFNKIPANKVTHNKKALSIKVKSSASPLLYPFKKTKMVSSIKASGQVISGKLNIKNLQDQGKKGNDDFVFRIGLVLEGTQTLSWVKRQIAPEWVLKMFSMAPKGSGVNHILFLEVANSSNIVGKKRNHHFSKYLKEHIVSSVNVDGTFVVNQKFDKPHKVLGLWISIDGDDTKSTYQVDINNITLN